MDVIGRLERAGYQFILDGDQIRYTLAPGREVDPATVKPLLEELRAHKQEAISFLRQREQDRHDNPDNLELALAGADLNKVAKSWELFRQQGYLMIYSHALGEKIAVVETEADKGRIHQSIPTYTFQELRLLAEGVRSGRVRILADLRLLHKAKKQLQGSIIK